MTLFKEKINNDGLVSLENSNFISIAIYSFILSGFLQAVYGLMQLYGILPSNSDQFKITGSFSNTAPFALYLAVVFPVALCKALFGKRITKDQVSIPQSLLILSPSFIQPFIKRCALHFLKLISSFIFLLPTATIIVILTILPVTMNRTSWLGSIFGTLVVLELKYKWLDIFKTRLVTFTKRLFTSLFAIVIITIIGIGLFQLKVGSSNGRLLIWEITLNKIIERPIFGYGLDRFTAEYNTWQANWFIEGKGTKEDEFLAGNIDFAYNEFLELSVETGVFSAILFLSLFLIPLLYKKNYKQTRHSTSLRQLISSSSSPNNSILDNNHFFTSTCLTALVTLLVCGMFSYPFYILPIYLLFFVFLSIYSANSNHRLLIDFSINPIKKYALVLLMFSAAILFLCYGIKTHKAHKAWMQAFLYYNIGNYSSAIKSYENAYPILSNDGLFLLHYGKCLEMNCNYTKSITILTRAKSFCADPITYITLGNCYKSLKQYQNAEYAYSFANYMEPNKFYPKYLLAKLYDETQQKTKAYEMASRLLSFPIKVPSTAIEEMRMDMKKIIEKNCN